MGKVIYKLPSRAITSKSGARFVLLVMGIAVLVLLGVTLSPSPKSSEEPWITRIFDSADDESSRSSSEAGRSTATAESSTEYAGDKTGLSSARGISDQTSHPNPFVSTSDVFKPEDTLSQASASNSQTLNQERIEDASETPLDDDEFDDLADNELGELSISGWVRTEMGDPAQAIEVSSLLKRSFADQRSKPSIPNPSRLTVQTDANGAFQFGKVSDGEYEVRVDANGYYESARKLVRAGADSVLLVVQETLSREVYLYGFVDGADGNFLPGVKVVPTGIRTTKTTYTDAAGNYSMYLPVSGKSRTYTLRFTLDGYRERLLPLQIGKTNEAESFQLNAQLEPIGELTTVAGSIMSTNGTPVHGAIVQMSSPVHRRSYRAVSDRSGQFLLSDIEVAEGYRFWVRSEGYRDYLQEGVTVNHARQRLPVTLEPLDNRTLAGRMVDSTGKPIPGFTLWVRSTQAATSQALQVTSNQAGMFSIDNVPEGAVNLLSQSTPLVTVSGTGLASGTDQEVKVTLDTGSYHVSGQVMDFHGEPMPGARAMLLWSHNENGIHSQSKRETAADANGLLRFSHLGPGVHTLIVEAPGYRSARIEHNVEMNGASIPIQLVDL